VYRSENGDSIEVAMEGEELTALWRGHFRVPLYPESRTDYFAAGVNGVAHFRAATDGATLTFEDRQGKIAIQGRRAPDSTPH
jgi:hypothetical protein